jgi:hypothetical protein
LLVDSDELIVELGEPRGQIVDAGFPLGEPSAAWRLPIGGTDVLGLRLAPRSVRDAEAPVAPSLISQRNVIRPVTSLLRRLSDLVKRRMIAR